MCLSCMREHAVGHSERSSRLGEAGLFDEDGEPFQAPWRLAR